jgi:hypothetical protein
LVLKPTVNSRDIYKRGWYNKECLLFKSITAKKPAKIRSRMEIKNLSLNIKRLQKVLKKEVFN